MGATCLLSSFPTLTVLFKFFLSLSHKPLWESHSIDKNPPRNNIQKHTHRKKKCAFYLIVLEIDLHIVAKTSMTGNYGFLTVIRRLYTFFGINRYIILTLQQCQCFFLMAVRGKILIHEISDSKWNLSSCSSQYLIWSTYQEIPKFILHHCPQVHEIFFINFILSRLSMSAICFNFNFI